MEENGVISAQSRAETHSDGIWRQRALGLGGGDPGGAEVEGGGALMGSGRPTSPAGGPPEALACGLALGWAASAAAAVEVEAAVRWADRLRRRRRRWTSTSSPCGLPSTPPHQQQQQQQQLHSSTSSLTDVQGLRCNKLCRNKQRQSLNFHLSGSEGPAVMIRKFWSLGSILTHTQAAS